MKVLIVNWMLRLVAPLVSSPAQYREGARTRLVMRCQRKASAAHRAPATNNINY